jgi:hypothetical protein
MIFERLELFLSNMYMRKHHHRLTNRGSIPEERVTLFSRISKHERRTEASRQGEQPQRRYPLQLMSKGER